MSAARLARFGRWGFYAGWLLGATFGSLAVKLDLPTWLVVAVGVATPFVVRWFTDRAAHRVTGSNVVEAQP